MGILSRTASVQNAQQLYERNRGWVHASIKPIAQCIAGQPFRLARVSGKPSLRPGRRSPKESSLPLWLREYRQKLELIEDHPFLTALSHPNDIMVRWSLIFSSVASLEITGKSFWWTPDPQKGERDGLPEIWPLPTTWVTPKIGEARLYQSWVIQPTMASTPYTVPGWQMAFIHYPDPSSPVLSLGTVQAQARAVVADEAMQEAQRRAMQNGIWPGMAIVMGRQKDADGKPTGARYRLNDYQRVQVLSAIKQAYRGVLNYDEPVVLDEYIENIYRLSNTPRELDFRGSAPLTKDRLTQGFGVNPIIMGQVGTNRAEAAATEQNFNNATINPKMELLSQSLTAYVIPRFSAKGERLVGYFEPKQARDPDSDLNIDKAMNAAGALTINEWRQKHGYPPVKGGDVCMVPAQSAPFDPNKDPNDFQPPEPPEEGGGPPKPPARAFHRDRRGNLVPGAGRR
jgi:hypothetical protein